MSEYNLYLELSLSRPPFLSVTHVQHTVTERARERDRQSVVLCFHVCRMSIHVGTSFVCTQRTLSPSLSLSI